MTHDEFVGQVQHRAHLGSRGDAEAIIRATFETLGERLMKDAAENVAAQLPPELGLHLRSAERFEHITLHDFYERIAVREHKDYEKAVFYTQAVLDTLREAISPGAVKKLEKQLPPEFRELLLHAVA